MRERRPPVDVTDRVESLPVNAAHETLVVDLEGVARLHASYRAQGIGRSLPEAG